MKTISAKAGEIKRGWFLVDAKDIVLGRLASILAMRLRGKHKPCYTPHVDCGDNIIVVNAKNVFLTGEKRKDKVFYWHTGYPGGIKGRTADQTLSGPYPERLLERAVRRMVPKGPLGRQVLKKLKIYAGSEHPHEAQNPTILNVAEMNKKNKKGLS